MPYLNLRYYTFHFRKGFSLFCLVFVVLFINLGIWQLHRYHFKQDLLTAYQTSLTAKPVRFDSVLNQPQEKLAFKNVIVTGAYQNNATILVQNKFYHDQLGYEVFTPIKIKQNKKWLLVDRGWILKPNTRELPNIPSLSHEQTIQGYLKFFNEYQFILGENTLDSKAQPLVLQKIDFQMLTKIYHQEFYPFVLRLTSNESDGLIRDWSMTNISPERNYGYAIQWFLMATVVVIAYVCFSLQKKDN